MQVNVPCYGRDKPTAWTRARPVECSCILSVYPKPNELRFIMSDPLHEADVLGITETWLNSSYALSAVPKSTATTTRGEIEAAEEIMCCSLH